MKQVKLNKTNEYIYTGPFDSSLEGKNVELEFDEIIQLNMDIAITSNNEITKFLSIDDLKVICMASLVKATIFPNGNVSFRKLDSSNDELKTCYLSLTKTTKHNYLICIAFDETQPMLYKAQLVSAFLINEI